jgi:hypothetical protein
MAQRQVTLNEWVLSSRYGVRWGISLYGSKRSKLKGINAKIPHFPIVE